VFQLEKAKINNSMERTARRGGGNGGGKDIQ